MKYVLYVIDAQTILSKIRSFLPKNPLYSGLLCEPDLKKILSISSLAES